MTRIRYKMLTDTKLQSSPILANKTLVVVNIDLAQLSYEIVTFEENSKVLSSQGPFNNSSELKKEVKNELKVMGVHFDDEVRNRKHDEQQTAKTN